MQYVTNGKFKFIWLPKTGEEQFFDLQKDPGECRDLINAPEYQKKIETWRSYLVNELENRKCGMTGNGKFIKQSADSILISPYRDKRYRQ